MVVLGSDKGFQSRFSHDSAPKFKKEMVSNSKPQGGNGGGNGSFVLTCQKCGESHSRKCLMGMDKYFSCVTRGHHLGDYPSTIDKGKDGR